MFNIFKKKPDDRIINGVIMEISMFMSWYEDTYMKMLSLETTKMISELVFEREGLPKNLKGADLIPALVFGTERNVSCKLRVQTKFDSQIDGFLQSINLSRETISKW